MSFRSFKKELEKKKERQEVTNSLNLSIKKLEAKRNEYAEKAKNELKKGNSSQYSAYVALLKNTMFNLSQAKDMLANYTIANDLLEMQNLNQRFVRAINSVMKDVYKISNNINVASSQKLFNKALFKQNYTSVELQKLLKDNNMAFANTVNTVSDISDEEVRKVLESEIRKDESNIDETIALLEKQYAVPENKKEKVVLGQSETPVEKPAQPVQPKAVAPDNDVVNVPSTENASDESEEENNLTDLSPDSGRKIDDRALNVMGNAYRPQWLKDYLGQPAAVATISAHISKAKLMGKALPHVLMCGSSGMGKTTFARIIANEMGKNFYEITKKEKMTTVIRILKNLKPGDIVFIDEIHGLSNDIIETVLYPAMEDFEIHTTDSNSVQTNCKTVKIAPFTLIGATTSSGRLPRPFFNRFAINITLKDYPDDIIATIVKNSFRVNEVKISDELCYMITERSQGLPRKANLNVEGILALAMAETAKKLNITQEGALSDKNKLRSLNIEITEKNVRDYFNLQGVDNKGLTEEDRRLLEIIIDNFNGGPAGLESLAKAMNVEPDVVDKTFEPYLVKLGLINIRPQGRFATEYAYKYLGRLPGTGESQNGTSDTEADNKTEVEEIQNDDDDLYEYECKTGELDEKFAKKFIELFSGEGAVKEQSLDELFSDADKDYKSIAKNRCVLKTENRKLYCDSKLERRFLNYIFGKGFATDAKTEALELEYSSGKMSGKRYFADFVLKLYDGTVAVVEMKNLSSIGYHLNVDKYEALEKFCTENGYRYAEIAKDYKENRYVSTDELKKRSQNRQLHDFIKSKIAENGICTPTDLESVNCDVNDLVCILLNDRSIKNVDRTGNLPQIVSAED